MFSQSTDLTEKLFEALKNDPRTKDTVVDIAFNQGIITLSGTVKNPITKNAVEEIAKKLKLPGVISVINEIKVK